MFTLFWAGNFFAPKTKYNGVPVQDYLQDAFVNCYKNLAE